MKFPLIALGVSLVAVLCSVGQLLAQQGDTNSVVAELSFPSGVTVQTASNIQISSAVKTAILNHPEMAKRIVSETIKQIAKGGRLVPQKLPSETHGAIVSRILVKEGDPIRTGQTLALMEINGQKMKFTATADGVVDAIIMTPGPVTAGDGPLAVISQTAAQARQAIRYVILGAAVAAPASIAGIVEAACANDATDAEIIVQTAKAALPDQADAIDKAAPQHPANMSPDDAAAYEITKELERLKSEGKLGNADEVKSVIKKVVERHTIHEELAAPQGAKVIAVLKHSGDVVHAGDKILVLRLPDGKELPIIAKADGVMQALNVSKGGIIGNNRPSSARNVPRKTHAPESGLIRITMLSL